MPCFIYSDNVGLSPLHIVAEYWGKRWVFFKQVIISMDGESYTKSFETTKSCETMRMAMFGSGQNLMPLRKKLKCCAKWQRRKR